MYFIISLLANVIQPNFCRFCILYYPSKFIKLSIYLPFSPTARKQQLVVQSPFLARVVHHHQHIDSWHQQTLEGHKVKTKLASSPRFVDRQYSAVARIHDVGILARKIIAENFSSKKKLGLIYSKQKRLRKKPRLRFLT